MPDWHIQDIDEGWPLSRNVPDGEMWADVCKGDINGVSLLLVALAWWKDATEEGSE